MKPQRTISIATQANRGRIRAGLPRMRYSSRRTTADTRVPDISVALQRERFAGHCDEQLLQRLLAVACRQSLWIAFEEDLAAREEQHAVAHVVNLVHIVRGP